MKNELYKYEENIDLLKEIQLGILLFNKYY